MADAVIKNDIRHFLGMVTNADSEDLKPEYCREIDSFEPLSTLLRKTLGGGGYFAGETPPSISGYARINVTDFVSDKLNIGAPYDISGNIEVFLYINTTTGLVKLYAWDGEDTYRDITTLAQFSLVWQLYLKYASSLKNPIIQTGDVLRFIAGKGDYTGSVLLQNGWMGWIDRKMYNGLYTISPKFYITRAPVPNETTDITMTITKQTINSEAPGDPVEYFYKYSFVYDYRQEGLLSDNTVSVSLYNNEAAIIDFVLEEIANYPRLTAINVYRSEDRTFGYMKIASINTIVNPDNAIFGDDAAYFKKIFFNNDDLLSHDFQSGASYELIITVDTGSGYADIYGGVIRFANSGYEQKVLEIAIYTDFPAWNDTYSGYPIYTWTLWDEFSAEVASGDGSDLQLDHNVLFFNHAYAYQVRVGDILYINGGTGITDGFYTIEKIIYDDNGNISLGLNSDIGNDIANMQDEINYVIFRDATPGYVISCDGSYAATMKVIDSHLSGISPHPLDGEVSIQVNANYACYLNGRMFLLDCILDPEDTAEEHNDLLMYSEYLQPDVVPVSNAISCDNPLGGGSMGLAPFFDSLLILMKHTIYQLRTLDITNPNSWVLTESPHKIGCISNKGYVVAAGSLYVAYYDGIYEFTPNMLAESDRTPVESMRISEPINNLYMRLENSAKESLIIRHDKIRNEIMVDVIDISETETSINKTLCYDLTYKTWRVDKYNSDPVNNAVEFYNKESHLVQWDDGSGSFIDINSPGARAVSWKSKTYVHEYEKYEIIKTMAVTYYSGDAVTVAIYDAEKGKSLFSKTLEAKTAPGTEKFGVRVRAKKYYIKVSATSSSNEVEIYRIVVESERSLS